jgi:hypothetical protein
MINSLMKVIKDFVTQGVTVIIASSGGGLPSLFISTVSCQLSLSLSIMSAPAAASTSLQYLARSQISISHINLLYHSQFYHSRLNYFRQ